MFKPEELSRQIAAYRDGAIQLSDFEEWFEDNANAEAYDDPNLHPLCVSVDAALSEFHFDNIGEAVVKSRLAAAIGDFDTVAEVRPELLWRWMPPKHMSVRFHMETRPSKIPVQSEWVVSTGSNSNSASHAHLAANNTIRTLAAGQART